MNTKPVVHNSHSVGNSFTSDQWTVFFGNRQFEQDRFNEVFPQWTPHYVSQVHGNQVVEASRKATEADGHWSTEFERALCIRTADCLPVMLAHPQMVCALHAGWRGLEQNIIARGLNQFVKARISPIEIKAFIGPHIDAKSFEVHKDVGEKLNSAYRACKATNHQLLHSHPDSSKCFVSLSVLAKAQLETYGLRSKNILLSDVDTYTSAEHHSYRRDQDRAGRLISFVVRTRS